MEITEQDFAALNAKVDTLETDNYAYRQKLRERKEEVAELLAQVPAEDAIVLGVDDAVSWKLYQALGKPEAIQTSLTAHETLSAKMTGMERDVALRVVAEASEYDFDVLSTLAGELEFAVSDGENGKVILVKLDGGTSQPIADYAETNWKKFLPSLQQAGQQQGTGQQPSAGRRMIGQASGTGAAADEDLVSEFIAKRKEQQRPSPLNPKE